MDMTGEKTKGRKRHIVTDTMGNLLCIHVHAANIHDTKGGVYTFEKALYRYPTIQAGCADGGYREHSGILLMNFITSELIFLCK